MTTRFAQLGWIVASGMLVVAFRPLLDVGLALPGRQAMERWFFAPDEKSPLLALGLAAWLVWRRRGRVGSGGASRLLTVLLLVAGLVCFAWARYMHAADLLLPALALHVLALGSALGGVAGCRALLLPALVLLIALPLPSPLHNEVIWALQRWTATAAASLLDAVGYETARADAFIRIGDRAFLVVEACSGLRSLEILLLVAIAVREIFARADARVWWVVACVPPLAFSLNAVRVAIIALRDDQVVPVAVAPGHLAQGMSVLVAGTLLLYGSGLLLAGRRDTSWRVGKPDGVAVERRAPASRLRPVLGWAAVLALASVVLPQRADSVREPTASSASLRAIPMDEAGWRGEDLRPDTLMIGELPLGEVLHRRYRKKTPGRPSVVELFVAYEDGDGLRRSPFSSKLLLPGHGWALEEWEAGRVWDLGIDAVRATGRSGDALVYIYQWHRRDEGFWLGTLRSMLALPTSPDETGKRRAVVRLTTPLVNSSELARDRSKQTLDRFVRDFRQLLADL